MDEGEREGNEHEGKEKEKGREKEKKKEKWGVGGGGRIGGGRKTLHTTLWSWVLMIHSLIDIPSVNWKVTKYM